MSLPRNMVSVTTIEIGLYKNIDTPLGDLYPFRI